MEKPVTLKVQKAKPRGRGSSNSSSGSKTCIVHDADTKGQSVGNLTEQGYLRIKEAAKLRLAQSDPTHRLETVSKNIPDIFDVSVHGTHRRCYQKFTNTYFASRRSIESTSVVETESQPSTSKLRCSVGCSASTRSPLFPSDKCLVCDKNRISVKGVH